MKPSDPLLLADGTLRCKMYPAGKAAISQHLDSQGFLECDHTVGKLSVDTRGPSVPQSLKQQGKLRKIINHGLNKFSFRCNGNDVASFYDQNHDSNHRSSMVGQSVLLNLKIGDVIQVSIKNLFVEINCFSDQNSD